MIESTQSKKIAVAVIKNPAGKILIVQRVHVEIGSDESRLTWVFPGGKRKDDETLEDTCVREVKQETGYNIKVHKKISNRVHPQFNTDITYFDCELANFSVAPIVDIHEVSKVLWVNKEEIRNYFTSDLSEDVAKFLGI